MLRRILLISALLILALAGWSCKNSTTAPASDPAPMVYSDIIIYSTPTCVNCNQLKSDLTGASYSYVDRNINTTAYYNDLMAKVDDASWYVPGAIITLPVVDVKGTLLENPSMNDIISYL